MRKGTRKRKEDEESDEDEVEEALRKYESFAYRLKLEKERFYQRAIEGNSIEVGMEDFEDDRRRKREKQFYSDYKPRSSPTDEDFQELSQSMHRVSMQPFRVAQNYSKRERRSNYSRNRRSEFEETRRPFESRELMGENTEGNKSSGVVSNFGRKLEMIDGGMDKMRSSLKEIKDEFIFYQRNAEREQKEKLEEEMMLIEGRIRDHQRSLNQLNQAKEKVSQVLTMDGVSSLRESANFRRSEILRTRKVNSFEADEAAPNNQDHQRRVKELEERLFDAENRLREADNRLREAERKLRSKEDELEDAKRKLSDQIPRQSLEEWNKEKRSLEDEISKLKGYLSQKEKENEVLRSSFSSGASSDQEKRLLALFEAEKSKSEQMKREHDNLRDNFESKRKNLEDEIAKLKGELQRTKNNLESLESSRNNQFSSLNQTNPSQNNEKLEMAQREAENYKRELETYKRDLDKFREELERKSNDLRRMESSLRESQEENTKMKQENQKLASDLEKVGQKSGNEKEMALALKEKDEKIAGLSKEVENNIEKIQKLVKMFEENEEKFQKTRKDKKNLEEELKKTQENNKGGVLGGQSETITDLQNKLQGMKRMNQSKIEELEEANVEISKLKKENEELSAESQSLLEKYSQLNAIHNQTMDEMMKKENQLLETIKTLKQNQAPPKKKGLFG